MPEPLSLYVYGYGELVSATGFQGSSLYVKYHIALPEGWYEQWLQGLAGCTQSASNVYDTSNPNNSFLCQFSHPIETALISRDSGALFCTWVLKFDPCTKNVDNPNYWPKLYCQVYSHDGWDRHVVEGYGYMELPSTPGMNCFVRGTLPLRYLNAIHRISHGGNDDLETHGRPHLSALELLSWWLNRIGQCRIPEWGTLIQDQVKLQSVWLPNRELWHNSIAMEHCPSSSVRWFSVITGLIQMIICIAIDPLPRLSILVIHLSCPVISRPFRMPLSEPRPA